MKPYLIWVMPTHGPSGIVDRAEVGNSNRSSPAESLASLAGSTKICKWNWESPEIAGISAFRLLNSTGHTKVSTTYIDGENIE